MEVEHEALMRETVQPRELKWNEKMGVGGVLNGGHGEMWTARDGKCFSKRWSTLIVQTWKSTEGTQRMVKIWQELFHLVRSAKLCLDPHSPSAPAVYWSSLFSTLLHGKDEIIFCLELSKNYST